MCLLAGPARTWLRTWDYDWISFCHLPSSSSATAILVLPNIDQHTKWMHVKLTISGAKLKRISSMWSHKKCMFFVTWSWSWWLKSPARKWFVQALNPGIITHKFSKALTCKTEAQYHETSYTHFDIDIDSYIHRLDNILGSIKQHK